jgi:uracil-DNA glycosylase
MSTIDQLIAQIHAEAQRESFPIDEPVYQDAGLDPKMPILYAGNLQSQLCFFARDLGKDEVIAGQPLYGAAGRLVRQGLYRALYGKEPQEQKDLQLVLEHVILTNTVPYKPPGNKAYSEAVKKRFRPFLEKLLVLHWQGDAYGKGKALHIITLGNEAFKWFSPYAPKGVVAKFFEQNDAQGASSASRYNASLEITLCATDDQGKRHERPVTLLPLPHPSPLNQQYYAQFPFLLQQRLESIFS